MNEIVNVQNFEGELVVTSRDIATNFEKEHKNVVRAIESLTAQKGAVKNMFIESKFEHKGNLYKEYLMNRDGFSLLVMGFTGSKALGWKLKYIEAFNKMEQTLRESVKPLSAMELLKLQYQAIEDQDQKIEEVNKKVDKKFDDLPLFPTDSKVLKKLVSQTVVPILGGKKSQAYKELSKKVFSDLYRQIHREFGVSGCEEIKRKDLEIAKEIISNYKLPRALELEIDTINSQVAFV